MRYTGSKTCKRPFRELLNEALGRIYLQRGVSLSSQCADLLGANASESEREQRSEMKHIALDHQQIVKDGSKFADQRRTMRSGESVAD